MSVFRAASIVVLAASLALAGCASPFRRGGTLPTATGSLGSGGTTTAGLGVNAYLWRATLDTLAFMPIASADPWGGVVVTDWYANPDQPAERFKATVYILDTRLRADGLNVSVFKQVRDASGAWADAAVAEQTETDIENAILTRARQLRLSAR